ncbi:MAG: UDP-N-acetylmuramate dehydrogenase [Actinomycetota bacterium]|nr:UDP-N-acetylmuramate dehydrogenase [Actinomycetota bacterium]
MNKSLFEFRLGKDQRTDKAYNQLRRALEGLVFKNVSMAKRLTFKTGGPASIYAIANSLTDLRSIISIAKEHELPHFVLGRGSNLLISDAGYKGIVIELGRDFKRLTVDGNYIQAGAANTLATIAQLAWKNSLSNFAFAVGIPGSLGGALVMNAGAHDGSMSDVVANATIYTPDCELKVMNGCDLGFSYRSSLLPKIGIVLEVLLKLESGDRGRIRLLMERYFKKRKETQPFEYPSAGSVFKNTSGVSAGRLIDEVGLKGTRIGDAAVSIKHANFIVNLGNAKASDVCALIDLIKSQVYREKGVLLETEIILLGDFENG